jgi:hypothetical protein
MGSKEIYSMTVRQLIDVLLGLDPNLVVKTAKIHGSSTSNVTGVRVEKKGSAVAALIMITQEK